MIEEIWKPIKGYEGLYKISNYGRLYSYPRKWCKGGYTYGNKVGKGYFRVRLYKDRIGTPFNVHCLVYETFVEPIPKGYDVHHINHNPSDNRVENLCLMETHLHHKKHNESIAKKIAQYDKEGTLIKLFDSVLSASKETAIDRRNIEKCVNNKRKTAGGYKWAFC